MAAAQMQCNQIYDYALEDVSCVFSLFSYEVSQVFEGATSWLR